MTVWSTFPSVALASEIQFGVIHPEAGFNA